MTGGPIVGIRNESAIDRHVFVPAGYSSGDPLGVSTATWTGETLDSLGLAIGSYTWTWAGDSMTVNIVPEPTTALLLTTGLAGLAVRRRRLH